MNKRFMKRTLIFCLMLVLTHSSAAKQLYKWQDDEGVWHFSDTPPETEQNYESRPIRVDPKPRLAMRAMGSKSQPSYHFTNNMHGPMEVRVRLVDAANVVSEPALPRNFLLEARQEATLFKLQARDQTKSWEVKIESLAIPGQPGAEHDGAFLYMPPFPGDQYFYISQGFHGDATHQSDEARYAVDITMPEGTPILAAREGIVMDVEDDFFGAGVDLSKYANRANVIRILHEDGSMAVYAHLKLDSSRVYPGTAVMTGQQIAESGNTGYSSGPHLHFAIQRNAGLRLESLPFRFAKANGGMVIPDRPMMLRGVPRQRQQASPDFSQ